MTQFLKDCISIPISVVSTNEDRAMIQLTKRARGYTWDERIALFREAKAHYIKEFTTERGTICGSDISRANKLAIREMKRAGL